MGFKMTVWSEKTIALRAYAWVPARRGLRNLLRNSNPDSTKRSENREGGPSSVVYLLTDPEKRDLILIAVCASVLSRGDNVEGPDVSASEETMQIARFPFLFRSLSASAPASPSPFSAVARRTNVSAGLRSVAGPIKRVGRIVFFFYNSDLGKRAYKAE